MELGWAVKSGGGINLRTVFPTEQGAKINAMHIAGVVVLNAYPDEMIEKKWVEFAELAEAECVRVSVTELPDPQFGG